MRFIHLSDLHLGKRVNEYSMLEDQRYILEQILRIVESEAPDGVLLAGDLYDRTVPSAEAVEVCDDFLCRLARLNVPVFLISGNHDSPERLAFLGRLLARSGVHVSPVYDGTLTPITLTDEFGPVDVVLLPFLKPVQVRRFFPEEDISTYTDAVIAALRVLPRNDGRRRVLVAHQFVTGAARSDSEELSVGGAENVDERAFDGFDYVALGHLHGPQNVAGTRIRYCGTPLKYSFSEARHHKSVTVVELGAQGELTLRLLPLSPLRDLRELRGTYAELTQPSFYENTTFPEDYTHITLTDEEDIPDAVMSLRRIYHNLMKLDYDNRRTRAVPALEASAAPSRTPLELFSDLYRQQNGQDMSEEQRSFVASLFEAIEEEDA